MMLDSSSDLTIQAFTKGFLVNKWFPSVGDSSVWSRQKCCATKVN